MTTLTTIRTGTPDDIHVVAALLGRAFQHDPVTRWLVPDPGRHPRVISDLSARAAADALAEGGVDVLTDHVGQPLGAALWFDHTQPDLTGVTSSVAMSGAARATAAAADGEFVSGGRWRDAFTADDRDLARWDVLDAEMTANHLRGRHHYLFAIGVDPAVQRRGLGSRLLAHHHQLHSDVATYLEATSRASRDLYQRHGYTVLGHIKLPDGPILWRMWLPHAPLGTIIHQRTTDAR